MIYAHISSTAKEAAEDTFEFIINHSDEIFSTSRRIPAEVIFKNGDIHCFMDELTYDRWCMGKTYKIADDFYNPGCLYHSDYPIKEEPT